MEPLVEPLVDGVPGPDPERVSSSAIEVASDACPVAGPCPARGGDDPYEKNMGSRRSFNKIERGVPRIR